MKPTVEQRHWRAVLDDPQTPRELRVEAARHLSIKIPVDDSYTAELDELVQSYWGTRPSDDPEADPRNAVAEKVCHAVAGLTLLGGVPNTVVADTETVLDAFAACQSSWMRDTCLQALSSACFYRNSLPEEIFIRIKAALDSVTDFDVLQEPEERTTTGS